MKTEIPHSMAYRRLVQISIIFGTITLIGGGLWVYGGAGLYGSPVTGSLQVDPLTGFTNYWNYWILWVVIAGPVALLPCALLERFFPRVGSVAMVVAALFVAEAGIRSGRSFWGYAGTDVLIVLGFITTPMLLLAVSLIALGSSQIRWKAVTATLIALILLTVGLQVRYTAERNYWNANCPARIQKL